MSSLSILGGPWAETSEGTLHGWGTQTATSAPPPSREAVASAGWQPLVLISPSGSAVFKSPRGSHTQPREEETLALNKRNVFILQ